MDAVVAVLHAANSTFVNCTRVNRNEVRCIWPRVCNRLSKSTLLIVEMMHTQEQKPSCAYDVRASSTAKALCVHLACGVRESAMWCSHRSHLPRAEKTTTLSQLCMLCSVNLCVAQ
jgi:hypothetical protein